MSTGAPQPARAAAFFDVDGTLVQTTIVHYYMYFRRQRMSPLLGGLWLAAFFVKCAYYKILDKISRSRLNIVFYRSYAGLSAADIKSQVEACYCDVIEPRRFAQAVDCVQQHRDAGHRIVLVTGSIDFIIEPLARRLGVADVVAPALLERNGRFTGELDGPPVGDEEKARRIRRFADEHGIDLSRSHAYGDSIADLPMLESVGFAHAVNPDNALANVANERGWPIHHWNVARASKSCDR